MFASRHGHGGMMNAPDTVMLMPQMSRYTTRQPWTIRKDARMSQAHELMRAHRIRHLPVLEAGKLVGIVSDRDLHLMETLPRADPDQRRGSDDRGRLCRHTRRPGRSRRRR